MRRVIRHMARKGSAAKRTRKAAKRALRNKAVRSLVKTSVRKCLAAIETRDLDKAREALARTTRTIDKATTKGVLHGNTAARRKSRLAAKVAALARELEPTG